NSSTATFGTTVTGGIQDVSALLPLLGTEQCERHIGSTLDKGYLYSAASPMSIFGSLGIAKAGFSIMLCCIPNNILGRSGSQWLADAGFVPAGSIASMMAVGPEKISEAEAKIKSLL
ncbi:hypothetical protein GYMLUDRAFT_112006, partial [Collybiopsis luxurians FD-317 M1]